ncbi:MAG: protein kinase [Myxococcota bacterium]
MEACPDEADLAGFVQGTLDDPLTGKIEAHIDGCDRCAQVVAELVRIFDDSVGGPSDQGLPTLEGMKTEQSLDGEDDEHSRPTLPAGAEVGRYRVLECIGFGGMGVVYSAYDPELDRRVALKVLRTASGSADETRRNARLLREAKVMAKLSHPNVIVVHDVGSYEERVFLAMEFVDGTTLARWMRAKERRWKDVREVFMAAGGGLAAAHEAGLVHRDFKPDNVLIGDDGRVRVTDFGLARFRDESIEHSVQEAGLLVDGAIAPSGGLSPTLATLTKTGVLVGTPAYMAPEQYRGGSVTGATDQFSFCVALYEALYGERPFPGRTLAELATNVCLGKRRPLGDANVPSRIRDAILRGLSVDPENRFPSMQALLAVLGRRPTRALRRWAMVGVPSVIAAVSLWWDAQPAEAGAPLCRKEGALTGLWNEAGQGRVAEAFKAVEDPLAVPAGARTIESLDAYAHGWSEAREVVCGAEADPTAGVVQRHCLMRARSRFEALLRVLEAADGALVQGSLRAVGALPDPAQCTSGSLAAANLVPLPPLELEERVADARGELDRVRALSTAGKVSEASEALEVVRATVDAIDYVPLKAELLYLEGFVRVPEGRYRDAKRALEEAAMLGVESHHRSVAADAWGRLVFLETNYFSDHDAAHRAVRMARAELKALGNPPHSMGVLRAHEAGLAIKEERYEEALATYEELLESPFTKDELKRADVLINLVNVHIEMGAWAKAIDAAREYVAIYEEAFGQAHANLVLGYYNLGFVYYAMDDLQTAVEPLRTSIRIGLEVLPANHPDVGAAYSALGSVFMDLQRYPEAVEAFGSARATVGDSAELTSSQRADVDLALAEAMVKADDLQGAKALLEGVVEAHASKASPDVDVMGRLYAAQGDLARAEGDLASAQALVERSIDAFKKSTAGREYKVASARLELAAIAEQRGDRGYAIELLDDVLATKDVGAESLRKKARTLRDALR